MQKLSVAQRPEQPEPPNPNPNPHPEGGFCPGIRPYNEDPNIVELGPLFFDSPEKLPFLEAGFEVPVTTLQASCPESSKPQPMQP